MDYNWDGDVIVQNSAVEDKRYIISCKKQITTDIREFVSPADDVVIKRILKGLAEEKGLPMSKNPGDFDCRAMVIWDHVASYVAYRCDAKEQRKGDFWLFPSEVQTLKYGDCEDGSFLLASLLIGSGISPFNVRIALGELIDKNGHPLGGHCWPMYKNEAGCWCILESTFDRAPWSLPTADRFTGVGEVRYVPHFCFNNCHLWTIRHEERPAAGIRSYLAEKSKRGALANMKNTRFPSGGWLSAITGDNSPGHLELTATALQGFTFSEDAISVASDAAQDPDFYEWYNPAAHAQRDCDLATGATDQGKEEAITAYLTWVAKQRNSFLTTTDDEHALFFLGYMLHGIQDLASHQGVTNSQHAYESYVLCKNGKDDCDHLEANRQSARDFSQKVLGKLAPQKPEFFQRMKGYNAGYAPFGAKVSKGAKCDLLGKPGWDLSMDAYLEYKGLADKYGKVMKDNPVERWDKEEVFSRVMTVIESGECGRRDTACP